MAVLSARQAKTMQPAPQPATLNLTLGTTQRPFLYRKGTSDEGVIVQVLQNSDYNLGRLRRAKELNDLYEQFAASGRTPLIIDAGANIGASAVYFCCSFPKARVVAIEPERANYELLRANAAGLPAECLNAAVAAAPGHLNVIDPGEGYWGFRTTAPGEGGKSGGDRPGGGKTVHTVTCVTVNDLYAARAKDCVPFMAKIDIEGAESELFAANTEWVDQTPIIIIELHDWLMPGTANSRAFLQCIAGRDRDFVHIGENIFSIANNITQRAA